MSNICSAVCTVTILHVKWPANHPHTCCKETKPTPTSHSDTCFWP